MTKKIEPRDLLTTGEQEWLYNTDAVFYNSINTIAAVLPDMIGTVEHRCRQEAEERKVLLAATAASQRFTAEEWARMRDDVMSGRRTIPGE